MQTQTRTPRKTRAPNIRISARGREIDSELDTFVRDMFKAVDNADTNWLLTRLSANPVIYDFDTDNNPAIANGAAECTELIKGYGKAMAKGLKLRTKVVQIDSSHWRDVGCCTMVFDQHFTVNGKTEGPYRFRGTLVARRIGGEWRMEHWHASFRELPAA